MAEEIYDISVVVKEIGAVIHVSESEWCKIGGPERKHVGESLFVKIPEVVPPPVPVAQPGKEAVLIIWRRETWFSTAPEHPIPAGSQ